MIILTAANKNFEHHLLRMLESVKKFNYNIHVYDLGGLGYGEPYSAPVSNKAYQKNPIKPQYILEKLKSLSLNELLVWMDADTELLDRIDELEDVDFDLGVTLRHSKPKREKDGRYNSGVLFFRNNSRTINFMEQWADLSKDLNGDQWSLNTLIKKIDRKNLFIREFSGEVYNNFYFDRDQSMAKILHYKSGLGRKILKNKGLK